MKFLAGAIAAALVATPVGAFTARGPTSATRTKDAVLFALGPEALTEYMAKAHEEKLKAVREAEDKKNVEIKALKAEVDTLKKGGALATSAPSVASGNMTNEEMAQKLLQYQQFMAKYIVEAQQQKAQAVRAAEASIQQKYEDKFKLLLASYSVEAPVAEFDNKATQLYQERSAKVSAAAKAGKSRWGDMENQRATQAASDAPVVAANGVSVPTTTALPNIGESLFNQRNNMVAAAGKAGKSRWGDMEVAKATKFAASLPEAPAAAASASVSLPVPAEVKAADHGLRNDGGVGGPSLAERVNLGSQLFGNAAAPVVSNGMGSTLYDKRNAMVAAAGKAGKSRWGEMEVTKVAKLAASLPAASAPASPVPVPPEVEKADHGLRADGGVGGPSLAQRVNLGAALLG